MLKKIGVGVICAWHFLKRNNNSSSCNNWLYIYNCKKQKILTVGLDPVTIKNTNIKSQ